MGPTYSNPLESFQPPKTKSPKKHYITPKYSKTILSPFFICTCTTKYTSQASQHDDQHIQGTNTPNVYRDTPHQHNHPPTTLKLPSPSSHYHPYKAPTLPDNHLRHHNPQLYTKTPPHKLPSQHHYQQTLLLHPTKPHTAIVTPITHKQLPDKLHLQSLTTSFNNARTTPIPIFLLHAHHYTPTSPHHWQRH